MPRAVIDGLSIAYDLDGPAGGPAVVLAHCFAGDRTLWDAQVPALHAAGFRVLRLDQRGHGESDAPDDRPGRPYGFTRMADDIAALMDAAGIARAHLCGVSMGGMIAQHMALRHGGRLLSLTLANTTSRYDPDQRAAWDARFAAIARHGIAPLHDGLMARWFTAPVLARRPPGVALLSRQCLAMPPARFVALAGGLRDIDLIGRLGAIAMPVLVIAGAEDRATTPAMAAAIHRAIPGSRLTVLSGAGHIGPVEQPAAFTAALTGFLATL